MAKRHKAGADFQSKIRRAQELIMAHSGIDEFYEIIRLIVAKYLAEKEGHTRLPEIEVCNRLLAGEKKALDPILDGQLSIQTPPDVFPEIQNTIGSISVTKQDFYALDQAFEALTARSYKSDKGQYFTPRHVVDMCVEAIAPKPGELICDPACGSGAFLKSAHTYVLSKYKKSAKLIGFDYSHRACQVAKLVSYISTGSAIRIEQVDSLRIPSRALLSDAGPTIEDAMGANFKGFDVIVTNPPFAGDISSESYASEYDVARYYDRKLERDVLFVERCIRLLKVGGRIAIVLPDNKVSSKAFGDLRAWLGRNAEVRAVVSLHRYTFLPYTSQKAAVIFAVRQPPSLNVYDAEVHFCRSDRPGKTSNGSPVLKEGYEADDRPYDAFDHDLQEIAEIIRRPLCGTS